MKSVPKFSGVMFLLLKNTRFVNLLPVVLCGKLAYLCFTFIWIFCLWINYYMCICDQLQKIFFIIYYCFYNRKLLQLSGLIYALLNRKQPEAFWIKILSTFINKRLKLWVSNAITGNKLLNDNKPYEVSEIRYFLKYE